MTTEHFDTVVIGTGSGNMILDERFENSKVALIEESDFGGTCLNRGCVPSKMFILAADAALSVSNAERLGVHASIDKIDWPAIRDRVFNRIDPIVAGGRDYRLGQDHVTVFEGHGEFVDHKILEVNGKRISSDRWLLGAGARPQLPEIEGLDQVAFETSDSIMRRDKVPEHLIVLGAGFIAAELGHVFGAFGSNVSYVLRSGAMLRNLDDDISARITELYSARFDFHFNSVISGVQQQGDEIVLEGVGPDGPFEIRGDALLVATGRKPNGDTLKVAATGVETDPSGRRVITNEYLETNVEGIFAFGDLTNEHQLKHLANAEAQIATHNLLGKGARKRIDRRHIPAAVFGSPQIAWVGMTETQARDKGLDVVTVKHDYASTAYGWALEDTSSFVKLVANRSNGELLGAHIIGPQAPTLLQSLQQGMQLNLGVAQMAKNVFYTHPALTEVVENALLRLASELEPNRE